MKQSIKLSLIAAIMAGTLTGLSATETTTSTVVIDGYAWDDYNRDGVRQDTEEMISRKRITLKNINDGQSESEILTVNGESYDSGRNYVSTDSNGYYKFSVEFRNEVDDMGQPTMNNEVQLTSLLTESGYEYTESNVGGDDTVDSDVDNDEMVIYADSDSHYNDWGVINKNSDYEPYERKEKTVSGIFWYDMNRDGIRQASEKGLGGREIFLSFPGKEDNAEEQKVTNEDGTYSFTYFTADDEATENDRVYRIIAGMEASEDKKEALSQKDVGVDDAIDSDAQILNANSPGSIYIDLGNSPSGEHFDIGVARVIPDLVSIGSLVWNDANRNGIQDADEIGIQDVTVELLENGETTGRTLSTNSDGLYIFDGLTPGSYQVAVRIPAGSKPTTENSVANDEIANDSNIKDVLENGTIAISPIINVNPGVETAETNGLLNSDDADNENEESGNMTVDFGLYTPATLSMIVKSDSGEPLSGYEVVVSNNDKNETLFTDANGSVTFDDLYDDLTYDVTVKNTTGVIVSEQEAIEVGTETAQKELDVVVDFYEDHFIPFNLGLLGLISVLFGAFSYSSIFNRNK